LVIDPSPERVSSGYLNQKLAPRLPILSQSHETRRWSWANKKLASETYRMHPYQPRANESWSGRLTGATLPAMGERWLGANGGRAEDFDGSTETPWGVREGGLWGRGTSSDLLGLSRVVESDYAALQY
jgi:hypothetical protein